MTQYQVQHYPVYIHCRFIGLFRSMFVWTFITISVAAIMKLRMQTISPTYFPKVKARAFEVHQERWHSEEEPDVEPTISLSQPPSSTTTATTTSPRTNSTANSHFQLIFCSNILHSVINNTNSNAERQLRQCAQYKCPLWVEPFCSFPFIIIIFGLYACT